MMESDSDLDEKDSMDKLELSSDSIDCTAKKRPRAEDSEDEANDLPAKKRPTSYNEQLEMSKKNNVKAILNKNGINEHDIKEKKHATYPENRQNMHKKSLSKSNMDKKNKEKDDNISVKQKNRNESPLNKDNFITNESPIKVKKEDIENEDNPLMEPDTNANIVSTSEDIKVKKKEDNEAINKEENSEEDKIKKERIVKSRIVDTEVVDGLELSVECASDKEGSSSESEDEKDAKPRPKTIIVKAEPNESELECSSSEKEESDSKETTDTLEIKSEKKKMKKRGPRTSFSKFKSSGSEDSQNNNSDEDYSPRTKKKMKKSLTARNPAKSSVESKRGRNGGVRKNSHKKGIEQDISDDENADMKLAERASKTTKLKNEAKEKLSEKEESSASKSDSNNDSEEEETSMKGRKKRNNNAKPEDNKTIQNLKKYLRVAGVRVRYNDIWADCKNDSARIRCLKKLLEKNGVFGRPNLEKCKRAKEEKEKMREVSELDTSNIISEGRVTRARRNMDNIKKVTTSNTSPRHREVRNTFKRIQVVDSDSE